MKKKNHDNKKRKGISILCTLIASIGIYAWMYTEGLDTHAFVWPELVFAGCYLLSLVRFRRWNQLTDEQIIRSLNVSLMFIHACALFFVPVIGRCDNIALAITLSLFIVIMGLFTKERRDYFREEFRSYIHLAVKTTKNESHENN